AQIPVKAILPARAAGAGRGQDAWIGDLEIGEPGKTTGGLCYGDLVAFSDIDPVGRFYRPGAVAVGLVSHGPSPHAGHGVGVTILVGTTNGAVRPVVQPGPPSSLGAALRALVLAGGDRAPRLPIEKEKP
ncbi:MAG: DUF4438 domain-containing protein, partial [Bifidobacteriaceae bacterium]|nr:DUF4438 domain-containing protein [Bifidobacteriaceae bacterium]